VTPAPIGRAVGDEERPSRSPGEQRGAALDVEEGQAMGSLSWWHWLIILAVFILLFGAKKLPDAARGLGRSLRILKSEVSAMHDDDEKAKAEGQPGAAATPTVVQPTPQISATPTPATPVVPPAVSAPVPTEEHRQ
jgi:sec-independent protein translocase protein TatA